MPEAIELRSFGLNLRELRTAAGFTQLELARRLGMKRTTALSLWERSSHIPEPATIVRIAKALKCAPAALLRGVITPYDSLRRAAPLTGADGLGLVPTDADEQAWLQCYRLLNKAVRRQHLALIVEVLRDAGTVVPSGALDSRYREERARRREPAKRAARAIGREASTP